MTHVLHETVPRKPNRSLVCIDQNLSDFDCPVHRHPEMEIVRIDESRGHMLAGDGGGRFYPGDVYLFPGDLPHAFLCEEGTIRARSRCLQFDPEKVDAALRGWPELVPLGHLKRRMRRGLCFRGERAEILSNCLDRLFADDGPDRIGHWFHLLAAVPEPQASEQLASDRYVVAGADRGISRLEPVLNHIHIHVNETIRIEDLAKKAGLSISAFHRLFRDRIGCTPISYQLDLRLSQVAHRLLETEDSIAEIAFDHGFNQLSNFNRQFKRYFGCSPRDYRAGKHLNLPAQTRFG